MIVDLSHFDVLPVTPRTYIPHWRRCSNNSSVSPFGRCHRLRLPSVPAPEQFPGHAPSDGSPPRHTCERTNMRASAGDWEVLEIFQHCLSSDGRETIGRMQEMLHTTTLPASCGRLHTCILLALFVFRNGSDGSDLIFLVLRHRFSRI